MIDFYSYMRPLLMALDPEVAHRMTLSALKLGLAPSYAHRNSGLSTTVFGLSFSNPLGLAAGFDKEAEVIRPMLGMGFGFVEIGTVTLRPQPGNPKPRLFRDIANESVINRLGFPGQGAEAVAHRLEKERARPLPGVLGVNIGINKETPTPVEDYRACIEMLSPFADYITINISSPNTPGLRNLQSREDLDRLLRALGSLRKKPLLLKIAPDLTPQARADIAEVISQHGIDGLIIGNTTVTRPPVLQKDLQEEKGGLSGRLLTNMATEVIGDFYRLTEGRISIIGAGGISSAEDAYAKICAGASLIQLYTALVFQGPWIITRILEELPALLQRDGFRSVADAVGSKMDTGKERMKTVI